MSAVGGTDATATPVDTPRPSRPVTPLDSGTSTPAMAPNKPSQPLITPLQREMVRSFDTLPQLERVVAWFPRAFNAHAVIIARNARNPKWAWQDEGREVVRTWAKKVVAAGTEAVEDASTQTV